MRRKVLTLFLVFFVIGILAVAVVIFNANRTKPSLCLKEYFEKLSNKDYEAMYDYIETDMTKEDFISRVKNIYEGIEASDINVTVLNNTNDENDSNIVNVTYSNSMETLAGSINFLNTIKVKNTNDVYKILWDSSIIFPDLKNEYKVRVDTLDSTRGTIYDRNNIILAQDGEAYSIGLVPGKMDDTTDISKISELLGIGVETINDSLNASYVEEDTFVPLRKISKEEQDLKNELLTIKGILVTDVSARVYPYKEATSLLTGYAQDDDGKTGLEYAYNERLKGIDGKEVNIVNENGKKVKTLTKKDLENGENIKTTIDVNIQQKIYEQFKEDKGAFVAINYNTGELLALVSTPSYDANDITLGVTDEEWQKLQNDENKPMYNRYLASYVPGSSLKPVIGAIGLKYNSFTADDDFETSGTKWQNSDSWGGLYVTTLETYSGPANLKNALVYSDNIYFAKAALKIGKSNLQQGLNDFGFNEKISFVQDMSESTYGAMDSESAIANSGYGQDQMLVNPIHLAMIYSSFANGGNMVMPILEYENEDDDNGNLISNVNIDEEEKEEQKYFRENVISSEIANIIKEDLIQVVEEGTGKAAKIEGKTLAGKTGTAEIKDDQQDEDGTEIGWFNAFDENGLLIISMCEDVKDLGGSHYLLPKVKEVFE